MPLASDVSIVVLAAGYGTRMKSNVPKVLHKIAGRPMVDWVINVAQQFNPKNLVIVIRKGMEDIQTHLHPLPVAFQEEGEGTAAAVRAALPFLENMDAEPILVLFGDTPFVRSETIQMMLDQTHNTENWGVVVLGFYPEGPNQYGRLVLDDDGFLNKIVEYKEATLEERQLDLCNSGVMLINGRYFKELLSLVDNNNAKQEFYLTDCVHLSVQKGLKCFFIETEEQEVMGINSKAELADAEFEAQTGMRTSALAKGVTLIDPDTVYFSYDTEFGKDVIIEPNVFIGPGVTLEDNIHIKSFCHIEGAYIGKGSVLGPFLRLRPGTKLHNDVHLGNFVEVKNSELAEGVKAGHLSYLGDAIIGAQSNIGAGTITCNYDGHKKGRTILGEKVFIGSNSALVAPVFIGSGAFIAAGSVVVEDVSENALAVARGKQIEIKDWAINFREKNQKE
jgi:bifunctional UDP-N-acetylglucosamine pyrophosphorylase / glucosamine-1-phosphate N-acetyltransferase